MSGEPLLPDGWVDRFSSRVDLDASFRELEGLHHFYVETMRGRVRSLQLRFDEAWEHFESATDAVDAAEDSIANLVRQFQLEIFRFENALVEEPLDPDVDVPQFDLPDIPEIVFEEYPEVKYVLSLRVNCEALLRLHIGQYEESHRLYERLGAPTTGRSAWRFATSAAPLASTTSTLRAPRSTRCWRARPWRPPRST